MTFRLLRAQLIPMADGISLCANVYLPSSGGPWPTLLTLTPYTADYAHTCAAQYVDSGFATVVVDVRGRGGSGGQFDLYNDGADGATCVGWAARQDWSTGKVALFGGSYSGLNQWQVAALRPPALKAIAPVCAPMPGFDADFFSGLFPLNNARWAAFIGGTSIAPKLMADDQLWREVFQAHFQSGDGLDAVAHLLGSRDRVVQTMIDHLDDTAFWAARVPTPAQFAAIDIPVFSVTGTADNAQRGTLEYRRRHFQARPDAQHWLMIGPWNHAGLRDPDTMRPARDTEDRHTLSTAEYDALVEFYLWALEGDEDGAPFQASEQIYVAGQERWIADTHHGEMLLSATPDKQLVSDYSETAVQPVALALSPDKLIADGDQFDLFDILGGEAARCPDILSDPALAVFMAHPFKLAITLCGAGDISVTLSSVPSSSNKEASGADIACLVFAAFEDGGTEILSSTYARVRPITRSPARFDLPPLRYIARHLPAGTQIGLAIFQISSPSFQKPETAAPVVLHVGADNGPNLTLPVLPQSGMETRI